MHMHIFITIYQKLKNMHNHIFMLFIRNLYGKDIWFLKIHRQTFLYIQMVVVTDYETLTIKDNFILRLFFKNKNVVLSCFWQLAQHWNEGYAAKLELACKEGNL